jgi:2,3-dihydroxybenzoate-AMP ligase
VRQHATYSTTLEEYIVLEGCVPWPDELAERYRAAGYWRGERLGDLLRTWAAADPDRVALVSGARRFGYGELDRRADRLAAGLRALGIGAGDRVVVCLPNGADFVTLSVALFRIGAPPVYALPGHRRAELEHLCRMTQARALVVVDRVPGFDFRELALELARTIGTLEHVLVAGDPGDCRALADVDDEPVTIAPPDPQDVAFFLLSGGTTGPPKLIPRTHDDYAYQLRCSAAVVGASERSVYLAALPIAHNAALGCPGVLGVLRLGGRVVMAASPSPDEIFELVRREAPTLTTVMPTFLLLWSDAADAFGADLSGLLVEVGGARLDPALAVRAQERLRCTLTHWFGMAEGVLWCTRPDDPIELAARTQGRPICPADEQRIVDEDDRDVAPGEEGELLVRGPMTLRGYYDEPEYNRRAFTSDGYLRTGDLVRLAPGGELVVTGRIKDVINRGGEKVAAGALEEHLRTHPAVRDAAAVAVPDAVFGERTCALLVVDGDALTLADVRAHVAGRGVAAFMLPDVVQIVPALPLTSLGKVDKKALRARLAPGADAGRAPVSLRA